MNQGNAQGNESEGVAFFIVVVHDVGLAHLAHEVEEHNGKVDCRQEISQNHRAGTHREEDHSQKDDRTD